MRYILQFVAKSIMLSLVALVIFTVPQIIVEVWGFLSQDIGYMWAINMAVAIVIALAVFNMSKNKLPRWVTWVITGITFVIIIVLCESIIWHPAEIGALVASKITMRDVGFVILGMAACTVVYIFFDGTTQQENNNNN